MATVRCRAAEDLFTSADIYPTPALELSPVSEFISGAQLDFEDLPL